MDSLRALSIYKPGSLKCVVNIITNYLMSALCPNLLELKNGKNIFQIVFLIGEAISPRSTILQKIISLGNFYLNITQDNYYQKGT